MFGMGTGGSLRLLSPERSGAPAFCCRVLATSVRPSNGLPTSFSLASASAASASHPQNRTGWFAFPRPDLDRLSLPLRHSRFCFSLPLHKSSLSLSASSGSFRFVLSASPASLTPLSTLQTPLFPRSSPRPISITKLHTLPHFHR